jgi:hypothetical protein
MPARENGARSTAAKRPRTESDMRRFGIGCLEVQALRIPKVPEVRFTAPLLARRLSPQLTKGDLQSPIHLLMKILTANGLMRYEDKAEWASVKMPLEDCPVAPDPRQRS